MHAPVIAALAAGSSSPSATAAASTAASASASATADASASATAAASPSEIPIPTINPITTPPDEWGSALEKWMDQTFSLGIWGTIIYAGFVALIAYLVIKLMQRTIRKKLTGNLHIFYRLLYILVIILAVMAVLMTITPLKDLGNGIIASSGIASVVVGLAAQESLANMFSGISIAVAKPFVVGDYIEIMGSSPTIMGTVLKITLRSTVLRDASNKDIVIPNSVIDHDIIRTAAAHIPGTDKTAGPAGPQKPTPVTNFLDVGVAYTADVSKAMQVLAALVAAEPAFVDLRTERQKEEGVPEVTVRVQDLAASSVNLRAFVPTHTVTEGFAALSNLRLKVLQEFTKQNIEIPYPYENVIVQQAPPDGQTSAK